MLTTGIQSAKHCNKLHVGNYCVVQVNLHLIFNVNSMFVTNFFFSSQTNRIKHFKPDDDSDSENNSTYNGNSTQQQ